MVNTLQNGRATINTFGNQLQISIPTKKRIFSTLFMCFWLIGWLVGEMAAISKVFNPKFDVTADLFMIGWLSLWTLGGGLAIFNVLWNLAGSETITVKSGFLQIKKAVLGIGFSQEYKLSNISNFRVVPEVQSFFQKRNASWNFDSGPIYFDYGMKTVKFGLDIDEAEANYIIQLLQEKGVMKETV